MAAQITTLGKHVYDLTDRELDLGLLGLAEFAPAALLVLVTGAVADRRDRKRVAASCQAGEAMLALALMAYTATDPTAVGPIFGLVVIYGVFRAFAMPSARALPPDVVGEERLPWLIARYSGTWQAAAIIGPVLAGFLYAADPALPYLAVAVLLGVASMCTLSLRTRPVVHAERDVDVSSRWHEAIEGLRFVRHHPVLLGAISLDLFAVLFGGAVALLPAIAEDRLGVGSVGLGWLRAAGGIGAALTTVMLAVRPIRRRVGRTLLLAVAVFGVATVVLGLTRNYAVAFGCMAVLMGADAISVFIRATLVPLVTPNDKRGRVLAVESVFIGASNELGAFESGVAGQLMGPAGAVVLGGAATLAIAGGWYTGFPALRDVDEFPGRVSAGGPDQDLGTLRASDEPG